MPTFILRAIDPELWQRVQAKALAEGITVKALILKALAQYVALVLFALASTACQGHSPLAATPVAPSPDLTAPASLTLDAAPGILITDAGTATITAHVRNALGTPLAAVTVSFSVDVGTIPASAITNAVGAATVALAGPPGPVKVTARVGALTYSTLVALQPAPTPQPTPTPFPPPTPVPPTPVPTPAPTPPPALTATLTASASSVAMDGTLMFTVVVNPTNFLPADPAAVPPLLIETITFYQWDLNGDNVLEFTSTAPIHASAAYAVAGPVTARVVASTSRGRQVTASVSIVVTN